MSEDNVRNASGASDRRCNDDSMEGQVALVDRIGSGPSLRLKGPFMLVKGPFS